MNAFAERPPAFSTDELAALARDLYGLSGQVKPLASERDQNARLTADGQSYVLKIANAAEDLNLLNLQNSTMSHLATQGVPGIPRLVHLPDGFPMGRVTGADGRSHAVRLVTWIGGRPLAETPRTAAQAAALGRFLGRLTRGLQGFGHPAAFRHDFPWSLDDAQRMAPWAADIADPGARARVERIFARHAARVVPRLPGLRASVLHQDANDHNVIVAADAPDRIEGLIDFGDMGFGRTVNELAIGLAYALLGATDLYATTRAMVEAYTAEFPLAAEEAELVFDLALTRLAVSLSISSHQSRLHPENDYLLISQAPALALIERTDTLDRDFLAALCRKAAGHDATSAAADVRRFLETTGDIRPPLPSLDGAARMALLTASLPDMPAYSDRAFDPWFEAQRPTALPAGEPFIGLGPYLEERAVYRTDQFADAASPERRTRHLGIDLFAPAGTALHAPLPGIVESVTYNADPLDYGHTLILRHETDTGTPFWTLWGHLSGSLPTLCKPGQNIAAGDLIAHIGDWPENGGWAPHLHFQIMTSLLGQSGRGNFAGVGHASLIDTWSDICIDPNLILRQTPEAFTIDPGPPGALLKRRAGRIGPSLSISYRDKLKIVRGQGTWLYDHTGRRFLDAVNNITHVGHCHPHVVAAIARQAAVLNTNTRYLNDLMLDLADRITARLPGDLKVAYFVNSGTEANELALRIARTALGRKDTLVLDWAYHGNSGGMVDISPYKFKRKGGYPQPDFVSVATFPDPYRGPHRGAGSGPAYAADVGERLTALRSRTGSAAVSFIAESLSGVGGQVIYPAGYLASVYEQVRGAGGIAIADEVQCGFGRPGTSFWGFEQQGVTPDIVVMGKPIGNGHPLACVVTTPDLARRFANGMEYFNSFGGNPVSMAVGHAVLDVIEDEGLQARAVITGNRLLDGFRAMAARHPLIGDVRGTGLFLGVELVRDRGTLDPATEEAGRIVNRMRARGVLCSTDGPLDNVLKFKPPMVFGPAEADLLLAAVEEALAAEAEGRLG